MQCTKKELCGSKNNDGNKEPSGFGSKENADVVDLVDDGSSHKESCEAALVDDARRLGTARRSGLSRLSGDGGHGQRQLEEARKRQRVTLTSVCMTITVVDVCFLLCHVIH